MNEVQGNQGRRSQHPPNGDRSGQGQGQGLNKLKLQFRVACAGVFLLAVAWLALASTSRRQLAASAQAQESLLPAMAKSDVARANTGSIHPSSQYLTSALSALPLMFEPNVGQTDASVKFMARGVGSRGLGNGIFLTADGATLSLRGGKDADSPAGVETLRMKFAGSNSRAVVSGLSPLPGKSNYLIGNDASQWHRNVPQFSGVRYQNIYSGIDLVFYGNHGQMEYDFRVAPGSNPAQAELQFEGPKAITLRDGNLILSGGSGNIRLNAPRIYQRIGDREQTVEGHFEMRASNRVGFAIGPYDHSRELVIDPVLEYSTYFGGSGDEHSTSIAVDGGSNIYLTGSTTSPNLPVSATPFQAALKGSEDAYVLKVNPAGTSVTYLTYLGGTGTDSPAGIAVDASGNAYVAGTTSSSDFPVTSTNAYQAAIRLAAQEPRTFS